MLQLALNAAYALATSLITGAVVNISKEGISLQHEEQEQQKQLALRAATAAAKPAAVSASSSDAQVQINAIRERADGQQSQERDAEAAERFQRLLYTIEAQQTQDPSASLDELLENVDFKNVIQQGSSAAAAVGDDDSYGSTAEERAELLRLSSKELEDRIMKRHQTKLAEFEAQKQADAKRRRIVLSSDATSTVPLPTALPERTLVLR